MIAASARPRIAYVLPTRDRPETLARTVAALERLPRHDAQVVVVDNASCVPPRLPVELHNGLPVLLLQRNRNEGAAARNAGVLASDPSCDWVVMLDDDSHPLSIGALDALRDAPADAGAVQAEILLPLADGRGRHESGGLPEVFIGAGSRSAGTRSSTRADTTRRSTTTPRSTTSPRGCCSRGGG